MTTHPTTIRPARRIAILTVCAGLIVVAGCGSPTGPAVSSTAPAAVPSGIAGAPASPAADASAATFPLTVPNCGEQLTIGAVPQRILSLAQPQTDMLTALGLTDRVVGQAQVSPPDGLPGQTAESAAEAGIAVIAADSVPAKEVTIAQAADLVLAPTTYEFQADEGFATEKDLAAAGAVPYIAAGGCKDRRTSRSVQDTLTDLETLGAVFGVTDRAQELAADYRGRLDEVATAVGGATPVRVAEVFVWGSDIQSLAGSSNVDLVKAAGGQNIFADDDPRFGGMMFASLSSEVLAAQAPEAFVFSAGSAEAAEKAKAALRAAFPTTPAVQNDKLIAYSATAALPGSLTTPEAVRFVAEQLHPDAF